LFPLLAVKEAVSVMGPFIVTDDGFVVPVKEMDPTPAHPPKLNPLSGTALIATF
jgi:hypothetical protein